MSLSSLKIMKKSSITEYSDNEEIIISRVLKIEHMRIALNSRGKQDIYYEENLAFRDSKHQSIVI